MASDHDPLESGAGAVDNRTVPGREDAGVCAAKCNFCNKVYGGEVIPKNLKCGHATCYLCIFRCILEYDKIPCVLCEEVTNATDLDEFGTSFELENIIEHLKRIGLWYLKEETAATTTTDESVRFLSEIRLNELESNSMSMLLLF
uniref:RING-type domain-containing protein n=1 Tax=Plectus sambesii TaxID=2011161 RepID=A0A914XQW1_9BILA